MKVSRFIYQHRLENSIAIIIIERVQWHHSPKFRESASKAKNFSALVSWIVPNISCITLLENILRVFKYCDEVVDYRAGLQQNTRSHHTPIVRGII